MKHAKLIVSIFLVICLSFTLCLPAFAATEENHYDYKKYVALGDSIPAGYGPYNMDVLGYEKVDICYTTYLADKLGAELVPLAYSAFRTQELRYMLEENYGGDEFLFPMNHLGEKTELRDEIHAATRREVADADLVTVQIGSNDILTHAMLCLMDAMGLDMPSPKDDGGDDASDVPQEVKEQMQAEIEAAQNGKCAFTEAISNIISLAETVGMLGNAVNAFVGGMYYGYTEFLKNMPIIVDDIRALNPDATIVIVGMYNPIPNLKLTDASILKIGQAAVILTGLINTYLSTTMRNADECIFADVMGTEVYDVPAFLSKDFTKQVITCVHPTPAGHEYICEKILAALPDPTYLPFRDVESDAWCFSGIKYCCDKGLMSGITPHYFSPKTAVNRAELVGILYKLAGSPDTKRMLEPFVDVTLVNPYRSAIKWAYNAGVTNGTSAHYFSPYAGLTRAQAVTMLYRYAGSPEVSGELSFTDAPYIGAPYVNAVLWATQNGIIVGYPDGSFGPDEPLNRAQLAVILERFCNM